jgi:hypothetical protein
MMTSHSTSTFGWKVRVVVVQQYGVDSRRLFEKYWQVGRETQVASWRLLRTALATEAGQRGAGVQARFNSQVATGPYLSI